MFSMKTPASQESLSHGRLERVADLAATPAGRSSCGSSARGRARGRTGRQEARLADVRGPCRSPVSAPAARRGERRRTSARPRRGSTPTSRSSVRWRAPSRRSRRSTPARRRRSCGRSGGSRPRPAGRPSSLRRGRAPPWPFAVGDVAERLAAAVGIETAFEPGAVRAKRADGGPTPAAAARGRAALRDVARDVLDLLLAQLVLEGLHPAAAVRDLLDGLLERDVGIVEVRANRARRACRRERMAAAAAGVREDGGAGTVIGSLVAPVVATAANRPAAPRAEAGAPEASRSRSLLIASGRARALCPAQPCMTSGGSRGVKRTLDAGNLIWCARPRSSAA